MRVPMEPRRRPEDFLELVERSRRGRLKVYLGYAAGVGKTFRMLQEAHHLQQRGLDVVLGYIETHGRAETEALADGLPVIPRRRFEYRGVVAEELDLDLILQRRPQLVLVDEVAHTNVPLCRNRKRYQDILEILGAGINVLCALNIQHLESLNDLLARITGVMVREKVPDSFLRQADQIVNIDLAVEDLQDRLRSGKIYPPEKVPHALEHFFQESNLLSLRELALREVAESLERSSSLLRQTASAHPAPGGRVGAGARVMVCMSSFSPIAQVLLRRGSRMAGRLNTDWFVVYVELPSEAPHLIDAEAQRHLLENIELARELGAEVIRLKASDAVQALIDFARGHGVGHVIIGRSHQPRWRRWLGLSFDHRMLNEAAGLDLHIVSAEDRERPT